MILTLVSKKGGVGKTTTAVNLAAALAGQGSRILLLDLDSQASASLSLGLTHAELVPSTADVMFFDTPVADAIRSTSTESLDLIPASVDLLSAERELSALRRPQRWLRRLLEPIEVDYDHIVIDCPPSMSLLPANALAACHAYLIPVVPQYLAVEGVDALIRFAERLQAQEGNRRRSRLMGLLPTMVDYRNRLTVTTLRRLRSHYGSDVFRTEIRVNVRLAEAPGLGQTIFQYDPGATGAQAYRRLARETVQRAADMVACAS